MCEYTYLRVPKPGTKQTRNKAHPQANAGASVQTHIGRLSARLPGDIAAHLKREEMRCATPTARWKVQWRTWQQWVMLEPQTLQNLLAQCHKAMSLPKLTKKSVPKKTKKSVPKIALPLVPYTWRINGHNVTFTVDLEKFEVRNMKTNRVSPLQCIISS